MLILAGCDTTLDKSIAHDINSPLMMSASNDSICKLDEDILFDDFSYSDEYNYPSFAININNHSDRLFESSIWSYCIGNTEYTMRNNAWTRGNRSNPEISNHGILEVKNSVLGLHLEEGYGPQNGINPAIESVFSFTKGTFAARVKFDDLEVLGDISESHRPAIDQAFYTIAQGYQEGHLELDHEWTNSPGFGLYGNTGLFNVTHYFPSNQELNGQQCTHIAKDDNGVLQWVHIDRNNQFSCGISTTRNGTSSDDGEVYAHSFHDKWVVLVTVNDTVSGRVSFFSQADGYGSNGEPNQVGTIWGGYVQDGVGAHITHNRTVPKDMRVVFGNGILNDDLGSKPTSQRHEMYIDWFFYSDKIHNSAYDVINLVQKIKNGNIPRLNKTHKYSGVRFCDDTPNPSDDFSCARSVGEDS